MRTPSRLVPPLSDALAPLVLSRQGDLPSDIRTRRRSRKERDRAWRVRKAYLAGEYVRMLHSVPYDDFWMTPRGNRAASNARLIGYYAGNTIVGAGYTELSEVYRRARRTIEKGCHVVEDGRADPEFELFMLALERLIAVLVLGIEFDDLVGSTACSRERNSVTPCNALL